MRSFSYNSYTKFALPTEVKVGDTTKFKGGTHKHLHDRYDFFMETYTSRLFKFPNKSKKKVLSTRVSGLQDPSFGLLATEFQSFSFYTDVIEVAGKNYVTPISKGAIGKYFYLIEDTVYKGQDTVFIISYRPYKNRNFEGLKGLLYINTHGYALQSVTAEPSEENPQLGIKIEQLYDCIDGQYWFPVQLNSGIVLTSPVYVKGKKVREDKITGAAKSYLSNISINKDIADKEFDEVAVSYAPDAGQKEEAYWKQARTDTLTRQEKTTYKVVDSVGKKLKLDQKVKIIEALFDGKYPLGPVNIDLGTILNFNDYEGFRVGLGAHTNEKVSKLLSIGGYTAYGFKDNGVKYGTDATVNLYKPKELRFQVSYANDVTEAAGTNFYANNQSFISTEAYHDYLVQVMDKTESKTDAMLFRAFHYADVKLALSQYSKKATNAYAFEDAADKIYVPTNYFRFTETQLAIKYSYGERFAETNHQKMSLGTRYPVLWLQFSKGFDNLLNGAFNYYKTDVRADWSFYTIGLGKTNVQAVGGMVNGAVPYANLYNMRGSNQQYSLVADNSFQTVYLNEFLADRYAALHISHNFGNLLYKYKRFKPELVWVNNFGVGTLSHQADHLNITYQVPEKGIFETGLVFNNLVTKQYYGYGVGFFYRYGPYSYSTPKENLAIQFAFNIAL